jgi:nicotinamidase-related amidase
MQTHMCVEAAVRAAHDMGYAVVLLHDACATRNLRFGDREVAAADVHASTLATLRSYAEVVSVEEWLKR